MFVVIPWFRGGPSDTWLRYTHLGDGGAEVMKTLLTDPVGSLRTSLEIESVRKGVFLIKLMLPLAFTPLLRPGMLVIILPTLLISLLSNTISQSSIYFHYLAPSIPFLFLASILGVRDLLRDRGIWSLLLRRLRLSNHGWRGGRIGLWFAALVLLFAIIGNLLDCPFAKEVAEPYYPVRGLERRDDEVYREFLTVSGSIPTTSSLVTMNHLGAHFSHRQQLYMLRDWTRWENRSCEYILAQVDELDVLTPFWSTVT
jgi:uncharacterized membrane protein